MVIIEFGGLQLQLCASSRIDRQRVQLIRLLAQGPHSDRLICKGGLDLHASICVKPSVGSSLARHVMDRVGSSVRPLVKSTPPSRFFKLCHVRPSSLRIQQQIVRWISASLILRSFVELWPDLGCLDHVDHPICRLIVEGNPPQLLQLLAFPLCSPFHQSIFEDHLEMPEVSLLKLVWVALLAPYPVHKLLSYRFSDAVILH